MEYIDRNAVLGKAFKTGLCDEDGNMYGIGEVVLVSDLVTIPTERVRPLHFGNWKLRPDGRYHCSECDRILLESVVPPFCSGCGASMERIEA